MADVQLTPLAPTRAAPANFTDNKTAATTGNNYLVANDGNTRILAQSTAGANITFVTPGDVDGLAIPDRVVALTAAKLYVFPPFPPAIYGDTLTITVSANTDLAAVKG